MVGGGPFRLRAGQWTDDTSMALRLATSLVERGGFDPRDQVERHRRWPEEGYLSSTGTCFDIGRTVSSALWRYRLDGELLAGPTHPGMAGNGCIMRLAPVPMFFFPDLDAIERHAAESSRTTHGATECVGACRLLGRMIGRALVAKPKEEVVLADSATFTGSEKIVEIAQGRWRRKTEVEIYGTGYVVS
jgi:ADP-ribosyl-[dinitrogen reductase] hydrolase